MAAGEGTRLRPLTERWPKPVLPIDGRPVIATLLRELAAAGVGTATIVVGHLADQVERLVGDGDAWGLDVRYAEQPRAVGSADAVARALAAGAAPPALITAADTVYASGDVAAFSEAFAASRADGALSYRTGHVPSRAKSGVRVEDGLVAEVYDLDQSNPFTSAPLWAIGQRLVAYLDGLPGPPYELKDGYQAAIRDGLRIAAVRIGRTRDLTDPLDLVEENFPYLSDER